MLLLLLGGCWGCAPPAGATAPVAISTEVSKQRAVDKGSEYQPTYL